MSLVIPDKLSSILDRNADSRALVYGAVQAVTPWLTPNNLHFFPEYTDHGFTHLNEVLLTSSGIITDDARNSLTPEDVAALIMSTVLHDCAMHITPDGFFTLIQGDYSPISSRFVDQELSWPELWSKYIDEAKKFSTKQLIDMFGETTPVSDIPTDKLKLTMRDNLLIGEFIRRHHARLAHEIALNGIPGCNGTTVRIHNEFGDIHFIDLCGFIARSHHLSLRDAVDCLESTKKRVHLRVHTPFIMLVLRIADYIQVHAERADKNLLSIKSLVSPISIGEWKKHHSIVEVIHAHDDPDAIYIDAEPNDAITYNELRALFSNIQKELDQCWSVLGEIYGRYREFSSLGINIRRIRSSLDNEKMYIERKKPNFIPRVLSFSTSSSEMIELLIAPLYGDNPAIGIRELLQNSVDACKELKDSKVKQLYRATELEGSPDIIVNVHVYEDKSGLVEIIDRGIGMTLDVINDYFLNIGASFRNSDYWRANHINDGHSTVHRTGRFGIGLLAAYLLGEKLTITTRHASQERDKAITFSCSKGQTEITVEHTEHDVGTSIQIEASVEVIDQLVRRTGEWDWYVHSDLNIERRIVSGDKYRVLSQKHKLPSCNDELPEGWFRTQHPDFDDIIWNYNYKGRYQYSSTLFCNGIVVDEGLRLLSLPISKPYNIINAATPNMIVFDQDGRLPINLERTSLSGNKLPFEEQLTVDISKFFVNELLDKLTGLDKGITESLVKVCTYPKIKGLTTNIYAHIDSTSLSKFLISRDKVIPFDPVLLKETRPKNLFFDSCVRPEHGLWQAPSLFGKDEQYYVCVNISSDAKSNRTNWIRTIMEIEQQPYSRNAFAHLPIAGRRIIISKAEENRLVRPSYVPKTFWRKLHKEWENQNWIMYSLGKIDEFEGDIDSISDYMESSGQFAVVQYQLDWDMEDVSVDEYDSTFAKMWLEKLGKPYIELQ